MDRFPVILFSSFFLLTIIGGMIAAVRCSETRLRWQGASFSVFGVIGLILTIMPFNPTSLTGPSLVGAYVGNHGDGTDTVLVHRDGTFDQRFVDDHAHVTHNHGTWDMNDGGMGALNLGHFLITFDGFGKPRKPEITNFASAGIRPDRIVFDDDNDIVILKTSKDDRKWP